MTEPVLLEEHGPLSRSLIWQVERDAYRAQGMDGWREGTVPHYITTNPYIAGSYASVLLGFLRDCVEADGFDDSQPVHIIELGAGPGRFGYHLLTQLLDRKDRTRLAHVPIRYVLSDLAEANVAFWQDHPKLAPLVDEGVLDFARFDIENDAELKLLASGDVLRAGSLANPGAVVANYVFDSVPQDCYRIEQQRLVALNAAAFSTQPEPDLADPTLLERLDLSFEETTLDANKLGLDEVSLEVLDSYRERLGSTMVLWPSMTIGCLDRLRSIWGGRMVLLSGDKGFSREDDLLTRGRPDVVPHGQVFSLMVNFHGIGEWFARQGGVALHPAQRHSSLNISLCSSGLDADSLVETTAAYHESIEAESPDDFFAALLTPNAPVTDPAEFLALVRLSRFDSEALLRHLPGIGQAIAYASPEVKAEIAWTARKVWETYFPIGEQLDLPFYLGGLLYELGWNDEAIGYLEQSMELYGEAGETLYNIALCHYAARNLDRAIEFVDRAAAHPDAADGAKALRLRIVAEMDRPTFGARATKRTTKGAAAKATPAKGSAKKAGGKKPAKTPTKKGAPKKR